MRKDASAIMNYKGCYDETQIEILESLFDKVNVIKKTMEHFEKIVNEGT